MPQQKQSPTGTREWAPVNYNFQLRCEHGCKYCYACANAIRFGWCKDYEEWATRPPTINMKKVRKKWKKAKGTIMFPTTHDITPLNLNECVVVLGQMLKGGNDVLIVSKPHLMCIQQICDLFGDYKDHILFRFTIGSTNNMTLQFWEPGAPTFDERLASLKYAYEKGFKTSVSSEPYLDASHGQLFDYLERYINDAIWFGPINKMETRIKFHGVSFKKAKADPRLWTEDEWRYWNLAQSVQTEEFIKKLYQTFHLNPKVKWKNRIKEILGLPIPKEIGLDE